MLMPATGDCGHWRKQIMGQHLFDRQGETGRINLPACFDMMSTYEFRNPFGKLLRDSDTKRVVVNLSNLTYIDSMGIGTLISWEKSCKDKGKTLVLERCDSKILKMFKLAGVDRLFEFSLLGHRTES